MRATDKIINVQTVRLIDIFLLSPFLFYAGSKQDDKLLKYGLYGMAVATLLYNGINYLNEKS